MEGLLFKLRYLASAHKKGIAGFLDTDTHGMRWKWFWRTGATITIEIRRQTLPSKGEPKAGASGASSTLASGLGCDAGP